MSWKRLVLLLVVAVVVTPLTAIGASALIQTFSDVPPSHPFYDEIEKIATAGISTGYADGTFRPSDNVTRQAMAAFMGRLGSTAVSTDPETDATISDPDGDVEVVSVTVDVPVSEGTQYVLLMADAPAWINDSFTNISSADRIDVYLSFWEGAVLHQFAAGIGFISDDFGGDMISAHKLVAAAPGEHTYTLTVTTFGADLGNVETWYPRLTAVVVPFGTVIPDPPADISDTPTGNLTR